jgi:hypothetical protein
MTVFVDPFLYMLVNWKLPFVPKENDVIELRKQFFRRKNYGEIVTSLVSKGKYPDDIYIGALDFGSKKRDDVIGVCPGFLSPFLKEKYEKRFRQSLFVMVRYNAYLFASLNMDLGFDSILMYQYWLLQQTVTKTVSRDKNVLLVDSRQVFSEKRLTILDYSLSLKDFDLAPNQDSELGIRLSMVTNPWFDTKEF